MLRHKIMSQRKGKRKEIGKTRYMSFNCEVMLMMRELGILKPSFGEQDSCEYVCV
jgi:hypothetical protein